MNLLFLLLSWLLAGLVTLVAGFTHTIYPWQAIFLIPPFFFVCKIIFSFNHQLSHFKKSEIFLYFCLIIVWISHFIQVLVPETGFDALWYHLPTVKFFTEQHVMEYNSFVFQTANPIFSDLIFLLGYQIAGSFGTKIIAYLISLTLLIITAKIGRQFLNRFWTLLLLITISLLQVVAWQSASFYVDLALALWQLGTLYFLTKSAHHISSPRQKRLLFFCSALFFGASLGSKITAIAFLPIFNLIIIVIYLYKQRLLPLLLTFNLISLCFVLPNYYLMFTNLHDYFAQISVTGMENYSSSFNFLWRRTLSLPLSIPAIFVDRQYLTPLLIFLPYSYYYFFKKRRKISPNLLTLIIFSLAGLIIYWFAIPPSSRYTIASFIILILLIFISLKYLYQHSSASHQKILISFIAFCLIATFIPRAIVNKRSLHYLTGKQTQQQYLDQFRGTVLDEKLDNWYEN